MGGLQVPADPEDDEGVSLSPATGPGRRWPWVVVAGVAVVGALVWNWSRTVPNDPARDPEPSLLGLDFDRDAADLTWTLMPEAPIVGSRDHGMVWTGEEVVVAGGFVDDGAGGLVASGQAAAFDVEAGRWRQLGDLPDGLHGNVGLIAAEKSVAAVSDAAVAWLDTAGSEWVLLEDPPVRAARQRTVWDGQRLVVVDGDSAAGWDPDSGSWALLSGPPVVPEVVAGVGGSVVVGSWGGQWARLDATDTWSRVAEPALSGERPADTVVRWEVTGLGVMVWLEPTTVEARAAVRDRVVVLDPEWFAWRPLQAPSPSGSDTEGVWRGYATAGAAGGLFAWGGELDGTPTGRGASTSWDAVGLLPQLEGRDGAGAVWTGSELVVWGGWDGQDARADGWRYLDPYQRWPHVTDPWQVDGAVVGFDDVGPFALDITEARLSWDTPDEVRFWFDRGWDQEMRLPGIGFGLSVEDATADRIVRISISEFSRGATEELGNVTWWLPLDPPLPWLALPPGESASSKAGASWPDMEVTLSRPADTTWDLTLTGQPEDDERGVGLDRVVIELVVDPPEPPWQHVVVNATIARRGVSQRWELDARAPAHNPLVADRTLQAIHAQGGPNELPLSEQGPLDQVDVHPALPPVHDEAPEYEVRVQGEQLTIIASATGTARTLNLPREVEVGHLNDDTAILLADDAIAWLELDTATITRVTHTPFPFEHVAGDAATTYATAGPLVFDLTATPIVIAAVPGEVVAVETADNQVYVLTRDGNITALEPAAHTFAGTPMRQARLDNAARLLRDRGRILIIDSNGHAYELAR